MLAQDSLESTTEFSAALKVAVLDSAVDAFELLVVDNITTNTDAVNTDGYSFLTTDVPFSDQTTTIVVDTGDDSDSGADNSLETSTGVDFEWLATVTDADGVIETQITMLDSGLLNIVEYNEDGTAAETSTFYDLDDTQEFSILQVDAEGEITQIDDFEGPFFEAHDFGF